MANYCCTVRTNYFHVKDIEKFRDLMSRVCGYEDGIDLWEEVDSDGNPFFAFGCYGGIAGLPNEDEDPDYDAFLDELQKCVAEDDAVIILESGNEKLRYVNGSATIITSTERVYNDIKSIAMRKAAGLLGDPYWLLRTRCYY